MFRKGDVSLLASTFLPCNVRNFLLWPLLAMLVYAVYSFHSVFHVF